MPRVSAAHEEQTRQRIVEAALRAFVGHGFHQATIQDVVRESGLSVGAIYTYFSGKEDLLRASCDLVLNQELEALSGLLGRATTVREKLEISVRFWFDFIERDPAQAAFIVQAWGEAPQTPAIREMLVRRRERLSTFAQMLLGEGVARGELPAWIDTEALSRGFGALLDGLLLQWIEDGPAYRRAAAEPRVHAFLELLYGAAGNPW
ncbi:MAG: TetR family transcriptional regulator [Chloroflexi bacterium]|nr:TetR family transcriptional regulator [Chloroflexota bacterium]